MENKNQRILFYRRPLDSRLSPGSAPFVESPVTPGTDAVHQVDARGELVESNWVFVTSGMASVERASRPLEIIDGGTSSSQMQWVLRFNRNRSLLRIDHLCIAWCPARSIIYEVCGDPILSEEKDEVLIYVYQNVTRFIDTGLLPRP